MIKIFKIGACAFLISLFCVNSAAAALQSSVIKSNIEKTYNDVFSKEKIPLFLSSFSKNFSKRVEFLNAIADAVKFVDENNKGLFLGASENLTNAKKTLAQLRNDLIRNFNELNDRYEAYRIVGTSEKEKHKSELKNLVHTFINIRPIANIELKKLNSLGESHYNSKGQKESFQLLVLALSKLVGVSSMVEDVLERF